ncbi:LEA type 2 family protein [Ramlibacter sp. USB13]|uniref:LEA type 2 family protein n=1 Tax=Ramlibacter cellulosilyticus TaxID=2764187 RepID=A0A923MTL7_9BURK|nr:LEA type 2 family protein [Ramlibacter cellulosilyticus]MBC5784950.1 LEA type 2 family protein [Ramlibacter cellulosilyticus]
MMRRRQAMPAALLLLAGCASLPGREPPVVQVADLQAADGEGMELRFLCVLRVQNPNEAPLDFRGVVIDLQVRGSAFASGVADLAGTVPPFGEVLVTVPVTASAVNLARLAIGLFMGEERPRVDYHLRGRIGSARFESRGELTLPGWPGSGGMRS